MARTPPCGDVDCTTHAALALFGKAHALDILFAVVHEEPRPWRFNELKQHLQITASVLAERLKEMEALGLLLRTEHNEMPRRVEYQATPDALELDEGFAAFKRWAARRHRASAPLLTVGPS